MKTPRLFSIILMFLYNAIMSQVGIGTVNPHSSSILDLYSDNKGVLLPKLALSGKNDNASIKNPANGLLIYNLSASGSGSNSVLPNSFYYWQNNIWQKLISSIEINNLKTSYQFVIETKNNQTFNDSEVNDVNLSEDNYVVLSWMPEEILIDNPNDMELLSDNVTFKIKTSSFYRAMANFAFNPKRNVNTDNSNYTQVAFSIIQSKDNGISWKPILGTAMPIDNGTSNQTQTIIMPRAFLSFAKDDLIKIVVFKPDDTTPSFGIGAGVIAKSAGDITKYLRIRKIITN